MAVLDLHQRSKNFHKIMPRFSVIANVKTLMHCKIIAVSYVAKYGIYNNRVYSFMFNRNILNFDHTLLPVFYEKKWFLWRSFI